MREFLFLSALASFHGLVSAHETVNRTLTQGWGTVPSQRRYTNAAQSRAAIEAGVQQSMAIGVQNSIAVLDPSAQLVAFLRMDNGFLSSMDISIKKAKIVSLFNGLYPSSVLHNRSEPDGDIYGIEQTNGGLVVFGGGQPIVDLEGYWIGSVGVSGGTNEQDVDVSIAAAGSVGSRSA
ncbi:hypothetical protein CBER1_06803 [Cercospora berteroae]|uniref:DUF336-domain-containing protein n=1 Tax=Cercospora berteroae TaxID=357750 RepID=A0A2S6BRE7_9PEZI|nr:hypothetical protein CBER1_06803 [Cercospora berteroae]